MAKNRLDREIEEAKRECVRLTRIRSDGKPWTPPGTTRNLILKLLARAGRNGMTRHEIADEYPHRSSPSYKMLRAMEDEKLIEQRGERFFLRGRRRV